MVLAYDACQLAVCTVCKANHLRNIDITIQLHCNTCTVYTHVRTHSTFVKCMYTCKLLEQGSVVLHVQVHVHGVRTCTYTRVHVCMYKGKTHLLHNVIFAAGSSHVQQSVPSHVDYVGTSTAIDEHIYHCSLAVHGSMVHGSEPMLVPVSVCVCVSKHSTACRYYYAYHNFVILGY